MKTWTIRLLQFWVALGAAALVFAQPVKAEQTIMSYGFDLVTDYVSKGADQHIEKWTVDEADHGLLNVAPAIQPWFTLYGPKDAKGAGFFVGIWTSFALVARDKDDEKGTAGLSKLDEVDYTFGYEWSNKLGGFSASVNFYNAIADDSYGEGREYILQWTMPYTFSPYIKYYAGPGPAADVFRFGLGGGESLTWSAYLDQTSNGIKDITATIGYVLGGGMSLSFSIANRPNPELVGPYDDEGKYANFEGEEADYPPTIAWLTFSYSGSVTE